MENSVVNFTNILKAALWDLITKAQKNAVKLSVFFLALLGSGPVKALSKTLVKLTPDNVLNINLDRSKEMRKSF
jgi:hypothetical protein